ncbi:MAG: hypothetical protein HUJ76_07985 [Parasporobacterium sp.]|nr:hypothetical protein [Parasporobacterium sp.]
MTKVIIEPGICGFTAEVTVTADEDDEQELTVKVKSGCRSVMAMMAETGDTLDAYEYCLAKPGCSPFYKYAAEHFPAHSSCPVIAGITKCMEAEAGLALRKEASIKFIEE